MYSDRLLLASASPQRLKLMGGLGIIPVVEPVALDECIFDHLSVPERVTALAKEKASLSARQTGLDCRWILGADTLVELAGHTFGKPKNIVEARGIINRLAGHTHTVFTGLCILDRLDNCTHVIVSDTKVSFAQMTGSEIEAYLATGEWRGAAGGYRIQETASLFVEQIQGSFTGVVGLPIREFYVILKRCAFPVPFGRDGIADR